MRNRHQTVSCQTVKHGNMQEKDVANEVDPKDEDGDDFFWRQWFLGRNGSNE